MALKIKPEDYTRLRAALEHTATAQGVTLARLAPGALTSEATRWSILFRAQAKTDRDLTRDLYLYLNDSHIDSALRRVFRDATADTIAWSVAEKFGVDGQCYETSNGSTLDEVCREHGASITREDGRGVRYVFPDDSTITDMGAAWDFGYPDCWCWASMGHRDPCEFAARE